MRNVFLILLLFSTIILDAQTNWKPAGDKILTNWAAEVNPELPHNEYPRPQMQRNNWINLNGLWDYSITPMTASAMGAAIGKILVPFAVESALSGVGKTVGKDSILWYKRSLQLKPDSKKKAILHFGAVDWKCEVFINGKSAGTHTGGYDPFSFDITSLLNKNGNQEILVQVWDPTDDGPQPRGKQVKNPHGIWYTPVTGIWQTVWIEQVPLTYITEIRQTPDIDRQLVKVSASAAGWQAGDVIKVKVVEQGRTVIEKDINPFVENEIAIANPHLWSHNDPFLYDIVYSIYRNGKKTDEVQGYFGMRKISMKKDANGIQKMMLNNDFVFQYGPLDQGWWPDGLYTAPTDAALKFDIEKTKELGFNMIRKHVKVEPARWYYHCDKLGILVWQDMPSGDLGNRWEMRPGIYGKATDKDRTAESEKSFRSEWKEIINDLYNFPSIVVWVPFNEAWGQFKTEDIVQSTIQLDPYRLVNAASGGNFTTAGHIFDLHNYPEPLMPDPELYGGRQILVLGEFGGLGLPVEGHTWQDKNNWGYQSFKNTDELWKRYEEFVNTIPHLIDKGLSAAVYTQTTDVEVETNGLMTYDRKMIKFPIEKIKRLNESLWKKGK